MTTDNMSNEEAIEILKGIVFNGFDITTPKEREALDFAIKALERPQVMVFEENTSMDIIDFNKTIDCGTGTIGEEPEISLELRKKEER